MNKIGRNVEIVTGGIFIKTLYIIGNGFDIAHGLDTRYWKFREYLENVDPYFLRNFEELYNIQPLDDTEPWYNQVAQERWNKSVNLNLWSIFEEKMGTPNTTEMIEQSDCVTQGMPMVGIRDHMDIYWKEQFGFISKLQEYVKEWIESVDTAGVKCKRKALIDSNDLFLNFNYTDILEKVYGIESVLHIHGGVSSVCDIPPIMGHCNMKDIEQHRIWAKEADEKFCEAEASVLDAVADYLEEIYKDVKENMFLNKSFFNILQNVEHVVIIGWSAGSVDIPYLKEVINKVDKNSIWTVYYYDSTAYESLKKVFGEMGITDAKKIHYERSEDFWDK